jgi:hypothetical protein
MSTSRDRNAARVLNSLTREGRAYIGSADDSALTDFVHTFFCGDDPGYNTPGKSINWSVDPTLPNEFNLL